MKKRWTAVLALLLSALLLCGCAGADAALDTLFGQAGERDAARVDADEREPLGAAVLFDYLMRHAHEYAANVLLREHDG